MKQRTRGSSSRRVRQDHERSGTVQRVFARDLGEFLLPSEKETREREINFKLTLLLPLLPPLPHNRPLRVSFHLCQHKSSRAFSCPLFSIPSAFAVPPERSELGSPTSKRSTQPSPFPSSQEFSPRITKTSTRRSTTDPKLELKDSSTSSRMSLSGFLISSPSSVSTTCRRSL